MTGKNYEIRGDISVIFVFSKGKIHEALVDTDDLEKVLSCEGKWTIGTGGYVISKDLTGKRTTKRLHRIVMDAKKGYDVDHINHNRLDNTKRNLRVVSRSVNMQNLKGAKSNNKSTGIRNVCFHVRFNKYQVKMQINKKSVHGGFYDTLEEASNVASKLRSILMEGASDRNEIDVKERLHDILPTHKPDITNKGTGVKNVYYEPTMRGSKKYKVMIGKTFHGRYKTLEEAEQVARKIREEKYFIKER